MKDQLPVVFLVNLDRSTKRLESIDNYLKLADISYSRFSAIDGYQVTIKSNETNNICSGSYLKENKLKTKPNSTYQIDCNDLENTHFIFKGVSMTAGQFGIWCSNLILWKNIITNNHEQAIIFQDDLSPSKQDNFKWNILNFTNSLPDTYDVAFMDFNYYVTRKRKMENINQYILKPIEEFMAWGMHAVVYSKKGIEKLLNYPYYSEAGDCFILDQANKHQLEVYVSAIDFIRMKSFKSEIGKMGREMNDYEFFI